MNSDNCQLFLTMNKISYLYSVMDDFLPPLTSGKGLSNMQTKKKHIQYMHLLSAMSNLLFCTLYQFLC